MRVSTFTRRPIPPSRPENGPGSCGHQVAPPSASALAPFPTHSGPVGGPIRMRKSPSSPTAVRQILLLLGLLRLFLLNSPTSPHRRRRDVPQPCSPFGPPASRLSSGNSFSHVCPVIYLNPLRRGVPLAFSARLKSFRRFLRPPDGPEVFLLSPWRSYVWIPRLCALAVCSEKKT